MYVLQLPDLHAGMRHQSEVMSNVSGCRGLSVLVEIGRRGNKNDPLVLDAPLPELRVLQRGKMAADRDVESIVYQIDETVAHMQLQLQFRILGGEHGEQRCQPILRVRHRRRDPHKSARFSETPADDDADSLRLANGRTGVFQNVAADFGQNKAARRTVDELRTKLRLQCRHTLADRRFRQVQTARRCGKATLIDCLYEEVQIIEVEHQR